MSNSTASTKVSDSTRCKRGTRRDKKTKKCITRSALLSAKIKKTRARIEKLQEKIRAKSARKNARIAKLNAPKRHKCPNGQRKNRKTRECEPYHPKPRVSPARISPARISSAKISPTRIQSLFRGYRTRKTTNNLLKEHKELNVLLNSVLNILQEIQREDDEDTGDAYNKNTDRDVDADKLNIIELGTFISANSDSYTEDADDEDGDVMTEYRFDFSVYNLKINVKDDNSRFKDELDDILEKLQNFSIKDNRRRIKRR